MGKQKKPLAPVGARKGLRKPYRDAAAQSTGAMFTVYGYSPEAWAAFWSSPAGKVRGDKMVKLWTAYKNRDAAIVAGKGSGLYLTKRQIYKYWAANQGNKTVITKLELQGAAPQQPAPQQA